MSMKQAWVSRSLILSREPADFYSGARKILRNQHFSLPLGPITIEDSGFTKSKLSMLRRNYLNQASLDAGLELWARRIKQDKYGSIGVSTYNHFMKGNIDGASPRGSVMGPCIQSFTLTLMPDRSVCIDVFYRTTELYKKFPADLVFLRDELLSPFALKRVQQVNFHFANITLHPMYFVTMIPHMKDPIEVLASLKRHDEFFFNWIVKWTARYLCSEHSRGIQKFSQALRVQADAHKRIPQPLQTKLARYLRDNHPGHRNEYEQDDEDE